MKVLDEISILHIEIDALRHSSAPTREDYAQAIRDYFAETGEFEEWMVEPLMAEVDEHNAMREAAKGLCDLIVYGRLTERNDHGSK